MELIKNMTLLTSNSTALLKKILLIIGTLLPINPALSGWQFWRDTGLKILY